MKKLLLLGSLIAAFMLCAFPASGAVSSVTNERVLILLANFVGGQPANFTPTQATSNFSSGVASYYEQQSYGALQITAESHGWYQIPAPNGSCNYWDWSAAARASAQADGVDLASFTHFVYVFSGLSIAGCPGIAWTQPGSHEEWGGPNLATEACIGRHEFGHSNALNHTDGFGPVGGNCNDRLPAAQLDQKGWLNASVAGDGSYQLVSIEQPSGLRALQIPRGDGSRFVLEYRSGTPANLYVEKDSGVQPDGFGSYVYRVPADPCSGQTTLTAGRSFYDAASRVLVSYTGSGAVSVDVDADAPVVTPDTTPPSAPANLTVTKQGQNQNLSWGTSTDDRCGTITYKLYRNGVLLATTQSTNYNDSPPRRSTLTYYVVAVDVANNVSSPSNSVVVTTK